MRYLQTGRIYRQIASGKPFRILHINPDDDVAIVAKMECYSTRPRKANLGQLNDAYNQNNLIEVEIENDPIPSPEARSEATKEVFNRLRPALQELLEPGYFALSQRKIWSDIKRIAKAITVPVSTLNWAFTQVLMAGGVIDAAVPRWHKCGRKQSVGKGDYQEIPTNQPGSYPLSVQDFVKIKSGALASLSHDEFLQKYYPAAEKRVAGRSIITTLPIGHRPSAYQYKWHADRLLPLSKRLLLKHGEHVFQTQHRGKPTGQSAPATYPGLVSEIDWTYTDIVGVSRGSRLSIGRMVFYVICDAHCGVVQSAYATMESAKLYEAGRAILQCTEDKVHLCARHGLMIEKADWDMESLPSILRSDRGEIDSWKSSGLGTGLGITLEFCPPRRPDTKGTVESFFRVVRFFLRRLRGGTSGHRERLTDHPNVTAIYDFEQVQRLLLALAVLFNKRVRRRQALSVGMIAAQVLPVPRLVYRWAKERGCMREFPVADVHIAVLPTHFATVTADGIKLKGLAFKITEFEPTQEHGIEANDWLVNARRGAWRVEVAIDISTVDFIWLRHRPSTGRPVVLKCYLSDVDLGWAGLSWEEYRLNKVEQREKLKEYKETEHRDARAWGRAVVATTTAEAIEMTVPTREGMSARAQIDGVGERRAAEMSQRQTEAELLVTTGGSFFDEERWGAE